MAANNVDSQPTKSSSAGKKARSNRLGAKFQAIDGGAKTRSRILMDADLLLSYAEQADCLGGFKVFGDLDERLLAPNVQF